jgi:hypothetical protein
MSAKSWCPRKVPKEIQLQHGYPHYTRHRWTSFGRFPPALCCRSFLASTAPGVEAFSSRRENRKVTVNYGDAAAALSHESYHHARRQRIFSLGCQYRQCRYESYEAHLSLRRYGHSVSSRGFAQTTSHHRTNDYKNARLTPKGREALNVHSLPRITEASASSASSARTEWTTP